MIEDAKVQDYWNKFGTQSSAKAAVAGFPDFFIYKICEGYDGAWCDEIFIKLVASMWGCKILVLQSDSLHSTTYRYEGSFHLVDIILMYNSSPVKGHYSPVGYCGKGLVFESNSIEYLKFSPNYKKNVDLEECLDRRDTIWDLDDEKSQKCIFTKKRGYAFRYENKAEKEKEKQKEDSGKVIGEALMLKEDEIIIKKEVFEELEKRMKMLEEKVLTIGEDEVVNEEERHRRKRETD